MHLLEDLGWNTSRCGRCDLRSFANQLRWWKFFKYNTWEALTQVIATCANFFDVGWNMKSIREQPTNVILPICLNNQHNSSRESNGTKLFSIAGQLQISLVEIHLQNTNQCALMTTTIQLQHEKDFYSCQSISQLPQFIMKHGSWYSQFGKIRIGAWVVVLLESFETQNNDLNSWWIDTDFLI